MGAAFAPGILPLYAHSVVLACLLAAAVAAVGALVTAVRREATQR